MNSMKKISIAPMMGWTNRHFRYFMRCMSQDIKLYTEMIVADTILYNKNYKYLKYNSIEHPLALQIGGNDPDKLGECAQIAEQLGYDEFNINAGCPSKRVQAGAFGAQLMKSPEIVAKCIQKIKQVSNINVTVKCRIGVDEQDDLEFLLNFIKQSADVGCQTFIIHARKAWLKGLNPKQNRNIPKLNYQRANEVKLACPELNIIVNGGINDSEMIKHHLNTFDGVMLGRVAYENPLLISKMQAEYDNIKQQSTQQILEKYIDYASKQINQGENASYVFKPLLRLYTHCYHAKTWRQQLTKFMQMDKDQMTTAFAKLLTFKDPRDLQIL